MSVGGLNKISMNGSETELWGVRVTTETRTLMWVFKTREKAVHKLEQVRAEAALWEKELRPNFQLVRTDLTWTVA